MTARILIADDDRELCLLLVEFLQQHQLDAAMVHSAEAALACLQINEQRPDVLVLDIGLPGMDGLAALRQIRALDTMPIIMLSGRSDPLDRVQGLELGADDYLSKPCLPRELLARIHAVLRRSKPAREQALQCGSLSLSTSERRASIGTEQLPLTAAEFAVLAELVRAAGSTVSRAQLTQRALNRELERYDRAIDVHVSRLRNKLAHYPDAPAIEGIRGAGYQLVHGGRA